MVTKRKTVPPHRSDCPAAPAHHYLIEQVGGGIDGGTCIHCNQTKTWNTRVIPEWSLKTPLPVDPSKAQEKYVLSDEVVR